jgi:hypothetical protein
VALCIDLGCDVIGGRKKKKNRVSYADGGPRRRPEPVTGSSRHGWAGLRAQAYADGQAYTKGSRRRNPAYAGGFCTLRGAARGWASRPVRRWPQYLALGVWHSRRHLMAFL